MVDTANTWKSPGYVLIGLMTGYSNVSNEFGVNSRLRWAVQLGSDVFLVFNHHTDTNHGWQSKSSNLSAKLAWTFRY